MADFVPALVLIALGRAALALLDRVTGGTFRALAERISTARPVTVIRIVQ